MNTKSVLPIALILVTLCGCTKSSVLFGGADEKQSLPAIWWVDAIDDMPPSTFLKQLLIDDPDIAKITDISVHTFQLEFTAAGIWYLSIEYQADLHPHRLIPDEPHLPPVGGPLPHPPVGEPLESPHDYNYDRTTVYASWSGTYSITDSILSLVVKDAGIDITHYYEGRNAELPAEDIAAAEAEVLAKVRVHFLNLAERTRVRRLNDTLTLTAPVSAKIPAYYDTSDAIRPIQIVLTRRDDPFTETTTD